MSVSTFMGLQTALRGLLAQQRALDVTGHNIANVGTEGYSRQQATMTTAPPFADPGVGMIGTGVDVVGYKRLRDDLVDVQLRAETMKKGYAEASQDGLAQIESALGEPSDSGISSLLGQYWGSWQDVVNNPESLAARQALVQNASALTDGFNTLASQLSSISGQIDQAAADTMTQINGLGTSIGALNQAIVDSKSLGLEPNDLLDQRDLMIDQLSQLVNTSVSTDPRGGVAITVGGAALVAADGAVTTPPLQESDLTALSSGKLKGLVELRDTTIPAYQAQLDAVANALATQTNTLHAAGFDLNGNAGGAFFTGTTAATITVAAGIAASPATIAASATGAPGDSGQALAIADLRSAAIVSGATVDDAYSQFVTRVGTESREAQRAADIAGTRSDALKNRRDSISGVSLDEEMANLVQFQRGYQASARALTAMDDMLDTLISRTGRAGL